MHNGPYHIHISARHRWLDFSLKDVWRYRELIALFTRRTLTVSYRQTILGPLWLLLQPLIAALFQMVLFGNIAKLSTDGIPQFLFYFAGNTLWGFLSACVTLTAGTFTSHARLLRKVYFPRLVLPLSAVCHAAVRFGIQTLFCLILLAYYVWGGMVAPHWASWCFLPAVLLQLGLLGLGTGLILAAVTARYRDLSVLVAFGLQLWMYATPVVYPFSAVPRNLQAWLECNPAMPGLELFRYAFLGTGGAQWPPFLFSCGITLLLLFCGLLLFHRTERTFADIL